MLEGFVLPKSSKSRSLISGFSFQILVQLTNLCEHLSNSIHGGKQLFFIIQLYSSSSLFHFLLYVANRVKQSQTVRSGRFESNLLTWPGRPKHTYGNPVPTQHFPFLSSSWIRVTPFDYKSPTPRSTPGRDHACTRMRNNIQRG